MVRYEREENKKAEKRSFCLLIYRSVLSCKPAVSDGLNMRVGLKSSASIRIDMAIKIFSNPLSHRLITVQTCATQGMVEAVQCLCSMLWAVCTM